jgi:hypothetical protein
LKQNSFAADPDSTGCDVDIRDGVDLQRGQRQRNQRCDPIAGAQIDGIAQGFTDLQNAAYEHPAAARDGIMLLAAGANVRDNVVADAPRVEVASLRDLLE